MDERIEKKRGREVEERKKKEDEDEEKEKRETKGCEEHEQGD